MPTVAAKRAIHACCPTILRGTLARIEGSEIGYRLAKGAFWSLAGSVISRGLILVALIFVARILGKTAFGEFGIVRSTIDMFGVFGGFGLGLTATKYVAELRQSDPGRAGRIIGLSSSMAVLAGGTMALSLIVLAPWLAENILSAPHLTGTLRIAALMLFFSALNGAQTGALAGFEAFKAIAHVNLLVGLISFPALIFGACAGGLSGAVWALSLTLAVNWLLNHWMLWQETRCYGIRFTLRDCLCERSILWTFSLPAVLSGLFVAPVDWLCSALLVNQPGGYEEMGVFSAANQWYCLLLFLPALLGQVVLPVLSERLGQKDIRQSTSTLSLAMKANAVLVLPFALLGCIASPYIMGLYGEGYADGWSTLLVVMLTAGLVAIQTPVGRIIVASGRMWTAFLMNGGWGLLFLASTALLIGYGSFGLATARMISYVAHSIWVFGFAFWLIRRTAQAVNP